jgi:hypothetical protein
MKDLFCDELRAAILPIKAITLDQTLPGAYKKRKMS